MAFENKEDLGNLFIFGRKTLKKENKLPTFTKLKVKTLVTLDNVIDKNGSKNYTLFSLVGKKLGHPFDVQMDTFT
jgi:hypothetical protein